MTSSETKNPIKVLIIAPTLDSFLGGQAVQASRLLEKLNQEPNIRADIQTIGPVFFPKLQKIKYIRTFLSSVKYLSDIVLKIPRYDIIHIFSAAHFSFLLTPTPAVLTARLFGKKTILNYRSGQFKRHFANWHRTLKPTLRLFDKIVVPSRYLVDVFAEYGFKAQWIYSFVDTNRFRFREREKLRPIFFSNRLLEELYNIPCILRVKFFSNGTVADNIIVSGKAALYREENFYLTSIKQIGFINADAGDYRLQNNSPYLKKGFGGKQIGANLNSQTVGRK